MKNDDPLYSASEVGQFTFCSVSWLLTRKGYRSPSTKKKFHGMQIHSALGKKTHRLDLFMKLSYGLIVSGLVLITLIILNKIGLMG